MGTGYKPGSAAPFFAEWTEDNVARPGLAQRLKEKRPAKNWGVAAAAATLLGLLASGVVSPATSASADPSANDWYRLRMCESSNNYSINTGNAHYGAYQFDVSTWRSVGGKGYPYRASKAEQDYRALILYRMRGWQPWECAAIVGLRDDADARSGRISDIPRPGAPSGGGSGGDNGSGEGTAPSSGIPAFPGGSHWYTRGETSRNIKTFQDQMHKRGYFPVGTGEYGPNTEQMIKQLQRLNGLVPNGYLGPNTWRTAWVGTYAAPGTRKSASILAFPGGSHWYTRGETSRNIKTFQDQMHKRGYFPVGTGEYGPNTEQMIKQLQRLNGLVPNGYLGPNTWRAAWVGKYRMP